MVGDLGLGKALDMSSRLTMIAGTPSFVAPEQAQGERLDARADQYSLAALTYLLLTGRPPHAHASLAAAAGPARRAPLSTPEWPVPADVEAVVRRGLAADRDGPLARRRGVRRRPRRARSATGGPAAGAAAGCWPLDPELTQPGARPSPRPAQPAARRADAAAPPPRPPRAAWPWPPSCCWSWAAVAGYAAGDSADRTTTITDVARRADRHRARRLGPRGRRPTAGGRPDADATYPALSVGTPRTGRPTGGEGVFVGVLPGTKLPDAACRSHPECGPPEGTVDDVRDGDRSETVYSTDCPVVTVERVVQVAANRLLWVQVRSADRATAVAVLDSVTTHGL